MGRATDRDSCLRRYLVVEWWAITRQPATSVGRVSLMIYKDSVSYEAVKSGDVQGAMDASALSYDKGRRGSVVQRTVQHSSVLRNATRLIVFVANNNAATKVGSTSDVSPTGYSMLASCMSRSTVSCPRGSSGSRPCHGMGSDFTTFCIQVNCFSL